MANHTLTLIISEEYWKVLESEFEDPAIWINSILHQRANKIIDRLVLENTDRNPGKLLRAEKFQLIRDLPLKPQKEITAEAMADIRGE